MPAYRHVCPVKCGSFCEACGIECLCEGKGCEACDGVGYLSPHGQAADRVKVRIRRKHWSDAKKLSEAPLIMDAIEGRVGKVRWRRQSATAVIEAAIEIGLTTLDADAYPDIGTE